MKNFKLRRSTDNFSDYQKHFLKFLIVISIIMILSELFLFNYKSFVLTGKDFGEKYIPAAQLSIMGLEKSESGGNVYKSTGSTAVLTVRDLNTQVGTLYFDIDISDTQITDLSVSMKYTDEATSVFKKVPSDIKIVESFEKSKYEVCSFSGKSDDLAFTLNNLKKGQTIKINGIAVNRTVPFDFSVLRVLIPILFFSFLYWLIKSPELNNPYDDRKKSHNRIIVSVFTAYCLLLVGVFFFYTEGGAPDIFISQYGDQLNFELVEAFKAGKVYLLDPVSNGLLNISNPYDWGQRMEAHVGYKWDHLYYNGRYYSYYGIAPVLLLFLPYNLITGLYFPTIYACLLFSVVGVWFLGLAFITMMKNWFKAIPMRITVVSLIILLFTTGTLATVSRPKFYEAAESSGFMFFCVAVYFLFSSGLFTENKLKLSKLTFASLFCGLAVLSRPTFALYAVGICIWFLYGLFQYRRENGKKKTAKYLISVLLPLVILGSIQMAYNYARFDSVLDFGIKYSLTINDFTHAQSHLGLMMISLFNMLFAFPVINSKFPFINANYDGLGVNGYYFIEAATAIGTFWRTLPTFAVFASPKLLLQTEKGKRLKYFLLIGLPCLIFPLIIVAMTWESGYAWRYNIDFAWQMLLLAFIVIFLYYQRSDAGVKNIVSNFLVIALVVCILSNLALTTTNGLNGDYRSDEMIIRLLKIGKYVAFWS